MKGRSDGSIGRAGCSRPRVAAESIRKMGQKAVEHCPDHIGCIGCARELAGNEGVKKLNFCCSGRETGVQSGCDAQKTLDSGFRRNDEKWSQTDFFTTSLRDYDQWGLSWGQFSLPGSSTPK